MRETGKEDCRSLTFRIMRTVDDKAHSATLQATDKLHTGEQWYVNALLYGDGLL